MQVFDGDPLLQLVIRAGRGMQLWHKVEEVPDLHPAAAFALRAWPHTWPAALEAVSIFTDGSVGPAAPDGSHGETKGWSLVVVGRCGSDFHFLGALFHEAAGSGPALDERSDSNGMELAALIWALTW
eukprot:13391642-Heterocapsa_arctica.AAC.1